jgi:hypothetical protein
MTDEPQHRGDDLDEPTIRLERWTGPIAADDPDANFKTDVALYALVDPLGTITGLGANLGIPVGALCRYVLAKWATGGSGGLLELGPTMVRRLTAVCEAAEESGTDDARLEAYEQLRSMLGWLELPVQHPDLYGAPTSDRPASETATEGPANDLPTTGPGRALEA